MKPLALALSLALTLLSWTAAQAQTEISTWNDLDNVRDSLDGSFILVNNLDPNTAGYATVAGPDANDGKGFAPIGIFGDEFTGRFDGNGYTITGLFIEREDTSEISFLLDAVGLFGTIGSGAVISNLGLIDVNITGTELVGGLVGRSIGTSTISNTYATGTVTGSKDVGGLVGLNEGTIDNAHATASVMAESQNGGGLVGTNSGTIINSYASGAVGGDGSTLGGLVGSNDGPITGSHARGTVTSSEIRLGGLVGSNINTITGSYATGDVSGGSSSDAVGGLVGTQNGTINTSYATGKVSGRSLIGGLVGIHSFESSITESYASGAVEGALSVGGLVGESFGAAISDSYAIGRVSGQSNVGGLVGSASASSIGTSYAAGEVSGEPSGGLIGFSIDTTTEDSFWDTQASQQADSADGTGLTTTQMTGQQAADNLSGFDFAATWSTVKRGQAKITDDGYPILASLERSVQAQSQGVYRAQAIPVPVNSLWAMALLILTILGLVAGHRGRWESARR